MRSALSLLALAVGCSPLPEASYFRDGFDLATEFDAPVCEGTLQRLEQRIDTVARFGGREPHSTLQVYWLTDDLKRVCPREVNGCFLPGTSIVASRQSSLHHELVHAVLDNRGSQHFLEEGLAEVLGGESVLFDPDGSDPFGAMEIETRDYRNGAVNYAAASHFVHFLRAERGDDFLGSLTHALDIGRSPANLVTLLEDEFERGASGVQAAYYVGAPEYYAGIAREESWVITAADLAGRLDVRLDCDDASTMGPINPGDGGMYVAGRLQLDAWVYGYLNVSGDPSVEVAIFREADRHRGRFVQNWAALDPSLDPAAIFARHGEGIGVGLSPDEDYILMISAPSADAATQASVWLSTTDPLPGAPP